LIAALLKGVSGAKTIMSTARGGFALPGFSLALAAAAAAAAALAAAPGTARAAQLQPSASVDFRAPIGIEELERYRAQGLAAPRCGDMTVGVVLWDEYRRARPPRDQTDIGPRAAATGRMARAH
jgi:hypothetical protein